MQKVWFFLLIFLCPQPGSAQETFLRGYGFAEGLPSLQLFDLHSKSTGHLYLGSNIGLLRYNGIQFEKIPFREYAAGISYIKEDQEGRLWAKDFSNRLYFLQYDTLEEFHAIKPLLADESLVDYALDEKNLLFATTNTVYRYSLDKKKHEKLLTLPPGPYNIITSVVVTKNYYCVAVYNSLTLLDKKTGNKVYELKMDLLRTELILKNDTLFFASRGKQLRNAWSFDLKTKTLTSLGSLPNDIHSNYLRWWQGELYWCTNNGLYKHDPTNKQFTLDLLPQKRISDVYDDGQGNYWIATLDHGLFQMPSNQLKHIFNTSGTNEQPLSLCLTSNNTLLAGSNLGSIWKFNQDGKLQQTSKTLTNNEIQFLVADASKNVLYSSEGIHDLTNLRLLQKEYLGHLFSLGPQQAYIFATHYGLFMQTATSAASANKAPRQIEMRKARARHLFFSPSQQAYYLAYSDGLFKYDLKGVFTKILDENGNALLINHISESIDGKRWLSTLNRGVLYMEGDQIRAALQQLGLSNTNIQKTIITPEGNLWALTESGLDFYDKNSQKFTQYKNALSLGNVVIYDMISNAEFIFLATSEGILRMPLSPTLNQLAPKLLGATASINGKSLQLGEQTLPPNPGVLNIRFSALHFKSEGRVYPQYRVLPKKQSWITLAPGTKEISLLNLGSGQNVVELRLLANGIYSPVKQWHLHINKPLWQRWWVIALAASLLVLLTILFSRIANKRKSQSLLLQQQLASSQLTAMKAQMNPHFLYNVLNSIQGLIYADKKVEATDYLGKFSDLMRLTLNFSEKQWHGLEDEVEALRLYLDLEKGRFNGEFIYEIEVDNSLPQKHIELPSMLLQPFLENAIKHGLMHKTGHKQLSISFVEDTVHQRIIISIDDNGIGRKQAAEIQQKRPKKYASFATKAIDSRVDILNRWLERPIEVEIIDKINDFQLPAGTLVIIRIPHQTQTN
ncbi:MAG: histidine kinase [Sphingobacteriaceae bacterium]|nr:histidine kinase [Sphingobacteriaceae bacterium]